MSAGVKWTKEQLEQVKARLAKHGSTEPTPAKPMKLTERPTTDESKLNKTERSRLAYLKMFVTMGKISCLHIQAMTFKIGDDCRFTPDFSYVDGDGRLTFEDVKGFMREDALVKLKAVARKFTEFKFMVVKKGINAWEMTEIKP